MAFCAQARTAELYVSKNNWVISFDGEIVEGDADRLRKFVLEIGALPRTIILNSRGGDIRESVEIGKFIRAALVQTGVESGRECSSACFIIWASSVRKFPGIAIIGNSTGRIGLHRPYFNKALYGQLGTARASADYAKHEHYVRNYLDESKIPTDIVDVMFLTSSADVKYFPDEVLINRLGT